MKVSNSFVRLLADDASIALIRMGRFGGQKKEGMVSFCEGLFRVSTRYSTLAYMDRKMIERISISRISDSSVLQLRMTSDWVGAVKGNRFKRFLSNLYRWLLVPSIYLTQNAVTAVVLNPEAIPDFAKKLRELGFDVIVEKEI